MGEERPRGRRVRYSRAGSRYPPGGTGAVRRPVEASHAAPSSARAAVDAGHRISADARRLTRYSTAAMADQALDRERLDEVDWRPLLALGCAPSAAVAVPGYAFERIDEHDAS